jgi:hypothetical protein
VVLTEIQEMFERMSKRTRENSLTPVSDAAAAAQGKKKNASFLFDFTF